MKLKSFGLPLILSAAMFSACNSTGGGSSTTPSMKRTSVGNGGELGKTEFYIVSVTPNEELPSTVKYPSIQIQFSQPVVALEKLGEPILKSDIVSISPDLKGVFRWYGTSLLSFDCTDDLIPQKEYFITVNPGLISKNNELLCGQNIFSFHTEDLKLVSIQPGYTVQKEKKIYIDSNDIAPEYAKDIAVIFSNKVNPKVVEKFIKISDESNTAYSFTTKSIDDKTVLLHMEKEFPNDSEISVNLISGAVPDENCWATSEDQVETFHTLRPFEYRNFIGTSNLQIYFNHRIKKGSENAILKALSFNPKMDIKKEQIVLMGNSICINDLPVTYNNSYSFKLDDKEILDAYGQVCSNKISDKVKVPDADSFASYTDGSFIILESQFEPKRAFELQNKNIEYTLTAISGVTENYKTEKTKTFKISANEKNKRLIKTIELKDFLEKTKDSYRGAVKVEFVTDKNHKQSAIIQVTDLGVSMTSAWNKTDVLVASLSTGLPVQNASVEIYESNATSYYIANEDMVRGVGKKICSGKTNSQGFAELSFNFNYSNKPLYIVVKTADDRLVYQMPNSSSRVFNNAKIENGKIISLDTNEEIPADRIQGNTVVTKIFSDRGLYKPGEVARFKIIDRNLSLGQYTTYSGNYEVNIVDDQYWRSNRKSYANYKGKLSEFGTTDIQWTLPEDLKPGNYYVEYKRSDDKAGNVKMESFAVQYFERVRFQASASIPKATYYRGDSLGALISASYLGGGSLAGGSVLAEWTRSPTDFSLSDEKYSGYTFGPIQYNWEFSGWRNSVVAEEEEFFHESVNQKLSEEGTARVSVNSGSEKKEGMPYLYNMQASVTDAGNQMIGAWTSAVVHPASFYIGLSQIKDLKGFPKKGEKLTFDYALLTPEGKITDSKSLKENKISWELLRSYWEEVVTEDANGYEVSNWEQKVVTEKSGVETVGSARTGSISVTPGNGGSYLLRLKMEDSKGRSVITDRVFFVTGSSFYNGNDKNSIQLNLSSDKTSYSVGDVAHILLKSSLDKGRYLMTLEREGIVEERILNIKEPTSVIDVEIKDSFVPVVWVGISTYTERTGSASENYDNVDTNKPKSVYANIMLNVDTKTRTFDVDVKMDKPSYLPGGKVKVDLSATKNGKAVSKAELTLMVVDRGVLDLTGYKVGSPANDFYSTGLFSNRTRFLDTRTGLCSPVIYNEYSLSARELEMRVYYDKMYLKEYKSSANGAVMTASARACESVEEEAWDDCEAMADSAGMEENLQIRNDFRATAVFMPSLVTDENGKVSVEFTLPDSLTEYVVTVVGVKENDYGYSEDNLSVANPISIRDVETRILRPGDNGEAGVVITNIGDSDENVTIDFEVLSGLDKTNYVRKEGEIIRQKGSASVSGDSEKSIVVKSGDTKTLMFRVDAKSAGWITLGFTVKSKSVNEKIYKALEIEKPYVYESVSTVGQLNADENVAEEKIKFPVATDDGRGTFYVQLDATRLGTLRSAVDYVFHYPYGCMEQRSSAIMPLISFGDYIKVLGLQSDVEDAASVVKAEIASWADLQKSDGGFPYWKDSAESSFAVSLRIGEILALAKEHGISVGRININRLISYLQSELKKYDTAGNFYPRAYCYYVLSRLGKKISKDDLQDILKSSCSASEYAFVGLAALENGYDLAATAVTKIKNLMSLTTRGVSFQNDKEWRCWYYFNGDAERYALALQLFTKVNASDLYNSHLVWQLLEMEKTGRGRWTSTATTSRVLIALDSYIRANDLTNTDFSAEILLNEKSILSGDFKGLGAQPVDSTYRFGDWNTKSKVKDDKFSAALPKLEVPLNTEIPLEIKKSGDGQLFYTASMTYAIPAEEQKARDEGLCVFVEITNARTGEKVEGNKLVSGEIYREKVYVTSTKNRNFVAVRAPVPAGAEILNPAFATTVMVIQDPKSSATSTAGKRYTDGYYGWSISHQDIYDAEIRCFWDNFYIGSQNFEFLFRAQRSGEYESPAVLAECMYEPEIFGRSNGTRWSIE